MTAQLVHGSRVMVVVRGEVGGGGTVQAWVGEREHAACTVVVEGFREE